MMRRPALSLRRAAVHQAWRAGWWGCCGVLAAWGFVASAQDVTPGAAASSSANHGRTERIATAFIQQPWPRQVVRALEVGRYDVTWRQRASRQEGIFAGVRFTAPIGRQRLWDLTTDYADIGRVTPGVKAVRYLERTPDWQVIQLDVQVLWKTLQLTFEIEQDPPKAMRFRLVDERLGEYRGVCWLEEPAGPGAGGQGQDGTVVELATWLKPARPVPMGLILLVERMTFLRATESFLDTCYSQAIVKQ